jgi:hypothetical protein
VNLAEFHQHDYDVVLTSVPWICAIVYPSATMSIIMRY